ncbi:MAG: hypothetical protein KBT44_06795 [Bacteroidales bacterium]|nr:hypothetical protein [Candidatus Equibacterium intestinale]
MRKILLSVSCLLVTLLSGIALGWLSHIRSVPRVWLIIASVVLLGIVTTMVVLIKKGDWGLYMEQVPVSVRIAASFLVSFTFFNAHFFFTAFNTYQFFSGLIGGALSALILYRQLNRSVPPK